MEKSVHRLVYDKKCRVSTMTKICISLRNYNVLKTFYFAFSGVVSRGSLGAD